MSEENKAEWYSIADWGEYDLINGRTDNVTYDKHFTREAAEGVCQLLRKNGFGGRKEVYPVKTWTSQQLPKQPKTYLEKLSD